MSKVSIVVAKWSGWCSTGSERFTICLGWPGELNPGLRAQFAHRLFSGWAGMPSPSSSTTSEPGGVSNRPAICTFFGPRHSIPILRTSLQQCATRSFASHKHRGVGVGRTLHADSCPVPGLFHSLVPAWKGRASGEPLFVLLHCSPAVQTGTSTLRAWTIHVGVPRHNHQRVISRKSDVGPEQENRMVTRASGRPVHTRH